MSASDKLSAREYTERVCRDIAGIIKQEMPPEWGFALLFFELGPGGTMNYMSNAQRGDMVKALRELLSKLEGS